jgi:hypothetical protein
MPAESEEKSRVFAARHRGSHRCASRISRKCVENVAARYGAGFRARRSHQRFRAKRKGTDCAYLIGCEWIESMVHDSGCD